MRDIMNPATKLWLWCMAQRRTHVFDGEMRQKNYHYKVVVVVHEAKTYTRLQW